MHIGRPHIEISHRLRAVLLLGVIVRVVMAVDMPVAVIMTLPEQKRTAEIDAKPDRRNQEGFAIGDRNRGHEAADGFRRNDQAHKPQHDGTGESGQIAELARTESETAIGGMAAGEPIGPGGQPQRPNMSGHMDAIGQQRHRAEGEAGHNLDHHEDGGEPGRQPRAGLRLLMALRQKAMIMGPKPMVVTMGMVIGGVVDRHGTKIMAWGRHCTP